MTSFPLKLLSASYLGGVLIDDLVVLSKSAPCFPESPESRARWKSEQERAIKAAETSADFNIVVSTLLLYRLRGENVTGNVFFFWESSSRV